MKANEINYKILKERCDNTAKDLTHLQDVLLTVKFPEILSAIALLEFVSQYICEVEYAA